MYSALCDGTPIEAWQLDRVGRHDMHFTCPECAAPVISRCGAEMPWHFAHKEASDCPLASTAAAAEAGGESAVHMRAKYDIARTLNEVGYSVTVEEPLGGLRRPDITVVSPATGRWVTVEIQASPVPIPEMRWRWQHDVDAGATDVVWVWAGRLDMGAGYNVTLPDDILHHQRQNATVLNVWSSAGLAVAVAEPTWWICEPCSGTAKTTQRSQRPTCPTCGLIRPASHDDATRAYSLLASDGRIRLCRGRRATIARFGAAETPLVREPVAALL